MQCTCHALILSITEKGGQPNLSSPPRCILQRLIEGLSKAQALQGRKTHLWGEVNVGPVLMFERKGGPVVTPGRIRNWIRIYEASGLNCSNDEAKVIKYSSNIEIRVTLKCNSAGFLLKKTTMNMGSYTWDRNPSDSDTIYHLSQPTKHDPLLSKVVPSI